MWRRIGWGFTIVYNFIRMPLYWLVSCGKTKMSLIEMVSPKAMIAVSDKGTIKIGRMCGIDSGSLIRACGGNINIWGRSETMKSEIKLSIIILTMNRKSQLIEALDSCLICELPKNFEIIVVNNGSNDGTADVLKSYAGAHEIPFIIKNLTQNLGAGEGRNIAIETATGDYLFFLDDDAVIDVNFNRNFFIDAIDILSSNEIIATLTTRIFDECLEIVRGVTYSKNNLFRDMESILQVHGGGFFMKNKIIEGRVFPDIFYGYEELLPSIRFIDMGYVNVYTEKLRVIHKPQFDKWSETSTVLKEQKSKALAGWLTVKYILYPVILRPMIYMGFVYRCIKHFGMDIKVISRCFSMHKKQVKGSTSSRIKYKTVFLLFRDFGMGAGL